MSKKETLNGWKPVEDSMGGWKPVSAPVEDAGVTESDDSADLSIYGSPVADTNQFEQVLTNIPDINEAQKSNLRKLALNVKAGKATHEDLRDTILTYQNKNPKQDGSGQYYVTENMTAKPLASGERPPKGYDVANDYFGTQEEADKKGFLASAGSHLYNGVLKGVLGLETVANLPYAMATGEDADWYKAAQNRVESSLMKTPSYETEQELFDTKDLKGIGDFFDSDRYNFTKNTVQGAALSGLESITSFLLGTKGFGAAGTALSAAGKGSKLLTAGGKTGAFLEGTTSAGVKAQALGGAYAITLPEVLQYVDDAGIKGTDKYRLAAAITVPMALTEMIGGTEALFASNAAAKQSKSAVIKGVVDAVKRNADGPLTKEFLTETFKATTKEAAQLNKSFMRELGENVVGEAATEGLQEFEKQGLAELYDHISKEDNFKNNPLSLQAFGEYYNSALQGGLGSIGAGAVGTLQKRSIDLHEKQSGNVFEVVKKGPEAVGALKENIAKSVQDGEITSDQAAELIFKVDAYDTYNKQTSGIPLEDADKKKVFELTFEKSNLDSQIPTEYEQKDLNAIEQAKIDAKKKQAKDIQNEINDIIQKAEVMNKTTTAAKKTVEDVDKKIESETEKPVEGVGKPKAEEKKAVDPKFEGVPFEEISSSDWNDRKHKPEDRFKYLVNKLESENDTISGNLFLKKEEGDTYDTVHINLPGKKFVATASSAKDLVTQLRGHFKTEFVEGDIDNLPVTVKPLQLTTGKTVLGVFNENNGRFIAYVREHKTGKSKYTEKEIEELQHMQAASKLTKAELEYYKQKRNQPPTDEGEAGATENVKPKPKGPTPNTSGTFTPTTPYGTAKGETLTTQTTTNESTETTRTTEPKQGDVQETDGESTGARKEIKLRTGKRRSIQKIKDPNRIKALQFEVLDPFHVVLQYFSGRGTISTDAIADIFTKSANAQKETFARNPYSTSLKNARKGTETVDALAHMLWQDNRSNTPNASTSEYKDAIELAIQQNLTRSDMAKKLISILGEKEEKQRFENEEAMAEYSKKAEQFGIDVPFENIVSELEKKTDEELDNLAKDQKQFDAFGNEIIDIIKRDDLEGDVFQKPLELQYAEGEFAKAEKELKATKSAFDAKRKDLGKEINADQEDLFGERKSTEGASLFDERVDMSAYEGVIAPFKKRYDAAVKEYTKWQAKVKELEDKGDSQTSLFQQKSDLKGNIDKVVETMKAAVPNVKIIYDENLTAAGKWSPSTKTITINPYYAGLDTPIHEVGHILIDAMGGMKNKVINNAINQLKGTDLWNQTKERYPELNNEQLGYEVLAEAIGMEGAGIFDKQTDKNIFMKYLEYIFDWLKRNLGLEKNIARNLAKQIIAGIGTDVIPEGETSLQKDYSETVNGDLDATKRLEAGETLYFIHEMTEEPEFVTTLEDYKKWSEESGITDWFAVSYDKLQKEKDELGLANIDIKGLITKTEAELKHLIDQLESAMNDFQAAGDTEKIIKLNNLIGNVIDLYTSKKLGDVLQKEKGKKGKKDFKPLWEMTKEERQEYYRKSEEKVLSFDQYRELKFGKLNKELYRDIEKVYAELEREYLSEEEQEYGEALIRQFQALEKNQLREWYRYKDHIKIAKETTDLLGDPELSEDDRIDLINELHTLDELARQAYLNDAQLKLARHYWDLQAAKLSENKNFIYEKALKTDITPLDVHMKNLSHMPESSPELQQFSKTFNDRHFDMVDEASSKKQTYEKLGKKVIEETNKKLGLTGKALSAFSSDSAKYFEYMDDGKGNLLTLDQAKAKGLSPAQIEFLKYMRELIAERKDVTDTNYDMDFEVLKTDPSFAESFKAEGMLRAVSNFLGSSYNLRQVRIPYTDPNTGIDSIDDFATIEKKILKYGNKGVIQKANAIRLLMKYNVRARRQLKQGVNIDEKENPLDVKHGGDYSFDYKGTLVGKFDRPRDKNRGYSKDFYKAGIDFIDDTMHVKHMSKLVPVVNSLEYMAKQGYKDVLSGESIEAKPNAAKWIDEWRKMHLFKAENTTDPILDSTLKFLRHVTSATTMMFNVKASGFNLLMGLYNNWRAENNAKVRLGHKRLFGEAGKHKVNKDYAYGTINPYAVDILRKYKIVSTDADSNPKNSVGRLFENLGHGLTRYGEFQIQGSMFLGLLSESEYDSFKYVKDKHGIDHLVVKEGVDEAALKEKLLSYKDKVSDIQGKYAEKDRRNIMNGELGKAAFIFRVWIPDWWKIRFGKEYINADGKTVKGSWRDFTTDAFKELRDFVKKEGAINALVTGKTSLDENGNPREMSPAAKNFMANMKGAMTVAFIYSLSLMGGDDEKRKKGDLLSQALGNLLFIFDPETARFTITNPSAAIGTVNKFFDTFESALDGDYEKLGKSGVKLIPGNKLYRQIEDMTKE